MEMHRNGDEHMNHLENYYSNYDEDGRLTIRHGQVEYLTTMKYIHECLGEGTDKKIGFHAHNNQNLAFANTIETMSYGVSFLDATVQGMGRGAGNCATELLFGFLKNPKYKLYGLLQFIEKYMLQLRKDGVVWGFDLQYMLTGILNCHPRDAIAFTSDERNDYAEFYKTLTDNF
ncbi:MAG: hypothetical protein IKV76_03195 [Clostridia bacterium]|nr:hypothetical protein [Clostridia bacterium]